MSLVARLQTVVGRRAWWQGVQPGKEQGFPSWTESLVVEPARMKETITQTGEHALGRLMSQEARAGAWSSPYLVSLWDARPFCSGQVSHGLVLLRALAGAHQLTLGMPVQAAMPLVGDAGL